MYHCMNVIWNVCIEKVKINKKCGNRHQTFEYQEALGTSYRIVFEIFGLASLIVYSEVKAMKEACGAAHMKSILAIGELGTMENVYKVSFYIY